MSVAANIAGAAAEFRFNDGFLEKAVTDLSEDEWFRSPNERSNHIAWLVGHVIWTRKKLLEWLETPWSRPWLDQFARGATRGEASQYPAPSELIAAWQDVAAVLKNTLENAPDEVLSKPVTKGPPTADGKVTGVVNFLAYHETYHVGQLAYLRTWLGHKGLMG